MNNIRRRTLKLSLTLLSLAIEEDLLQLQNERHRRKQKRIWMKRWIQQGNRFLYEKLMIFAVKFYNFCRKV